MAPKKPIEEIEVIDPVSGEPIMVTPMIWRGWMRGSVFIQLDEPQPKRMSKATEEKLRSEREARAAIAEAHRHPIASTRKLLSPSERLDPYLKITPQPVLDRLQQVSEDRDRLLYEYAELQRIAESVLDDMDRSSRDGEKGGRPPTILPDGWWDERERIRLAFKRKRDYRRARSDLLLDSLTAEELNIKLRTKFKASSISFARRARMAAEKSKP